MPSSTSYSEGDHVVTSDGAYPTFNYHVNGFGGKYIKFLIFLTMKILSLIKKARSVGAKLVILQI